MREGIPPVRTLCLCGELDGKLIGGIRFTAIRIGETEGAALLGPLVVDPAEKGKGYGRALVEEGLMRARAEGFALVILVGDMPYYARFGFKPVSPGQIVLGSPAIDARQARKALTLIDSLPEFKKALASHERRLQTLEGTAEPGAEGEGEGGNGGRAVRAED